jgi:hypothetical protein
MMDRQEVLIKSKKLVNQIYEKMNIIEQCDTVAKKIEDMDICFSKPCDEQILFLDSVLSKDQLTAIREDVIKRINITATAAQTYLEGLDRKPDKALAKEPEPDPVEEKLKEILREEAKKIEDKPVALKPSEILEAHADDIEKMYKVDMATITAIAEKYDVKKTDVNTFLQKHKLFRRSYKKDDGFLDAKVQARQSKE